jgi:hypothetical protein
VTVYRLVSRGTVEELKYLRQVYKTQLEQETIVDLNDESRESAARLFRGVAGDKTRKGELFGIANLLKFKDGSFMTYTSALCDARKHADVATVSTKELLDSVEAAALEEVPNEFGLEGILFDNIATKKDSRRGTFHSSNATCIHISSGTNPLSRLSTNKTQNG